MLVIDLKKILERVSDNEEVVILETKSYATIGGRPNVEVHTAGSGFDWDKGKFFLIPKEPMVKQISTDEQVARELQTKLGWVEYDNRNLKAEIRKLKKELENAKQTN